MIGWIDDLGRWLIAGSDADALGVAAAVVAVIDKDGMRIDRPYGAQVLTELGWAGHPDLDTGLGPNVTYQVLYPFNAQELDDRRASSRGEFERDLAATNGNGRHVDTGTASCECPPTGPELRQPRVGGLR